MTTGTELQSMTIRELKVSYSGDSTEKIQINSPEAVYKAMKPFYDNQSKEIFSVICVNQKNIIDSWQMISIGTVSESMAHPREIFQGALISNSSAVILVHNHPSGDTTPSREDLLTTKRLVEAGKILGIPVLDHLIITNNSYLSLKESGNME